MSFLQPSDLDAILLSFKVAEEATLLFIPLAIGVAYCCCSFLVARG